MRRRACVGFAAGALCFACLFCVLLGACRRQTREGPGSDTEAVVALLKGGQYDAAIERLGSRTDPESLYLLGLAWSGKARVAPLPTPDGSASGAVPSWKPEERLALEFLERAVSGRPDHAGAHQAIAELLAPHALERLARGRDTRAAPAEPGEPDASVERVLKEFGEALQADPAGTAAAEALVKFATAAGRLAEADSAYRELLRRRREDAGLLVRYGDFLAGVRGDPDAALAEYAQALIWHPDDAETRRKVAAIHLKAAAELLQQHEYAAAEARLKEARRAGVAPTSAEAARLRELEQVLRDVRGR